MSRLAFWIIVLVGASMFRPLPSSGQVLVETERGPLEIIGLRTWTYQALEDSIARYAPASSLRSHACAAVLQGELGFASASVVVYTTTDGRPPTFVVTLVEPADSIVASKRVIAGAPVAALWPEVRRVATGAAGFDRRKLIEPLQFYPAFKTAGYDSLRAGLVPILGSADAEIAAGVLRAIDRRSDPDDLRLALASLASDPDAGNRTIAAGILANFPDSDAAWLALVGGLRDSDPDAAAAAREAFQVLRRTGVRKIDWKPALADLRPLLSGANAGAFTHLLTVLHETEIDPALARALLADNWHLSLSHARAQYRGAREPAAAFLGRVSGLVDAGPEAWQKWAESLHPVGLS
jgi:hypothetical protein